MMRIEDSRGVSSGRWIILLSAGIKAPAIEFEKKIFGSHFCTGRGDVVSCIQFIQPGSIKFSLNIIYEYH
ncbi:hypothetical protein BC343_00145 [Mucilaginibacter pedocola]|uniref:Uncharacterized protein n=1 Tax=Mucilaginibacter pedocola TaxID=1792845 RepID=A0A1S9PKN7_9SPHI|nr:hypothetical protein BC343_00145 [Mucilaginibacter pedocola]